MIRNVFYVLAILIGIQPLSGQIAPQLNQYLTNIYENHVMPGFSVVVVDKKKVLYSSSFGYKKNKSIEPFDHRTINPIGSLTKSITALAIMQLIEKGKLKLDDPVHFYLPEFKTANPEKSKKITIRMLLNNTSGLAGIVPRSYDISEASIQQLMDNVSGFYITGEPGTTYKYSNINYSIAGLLISKISGKTYNEYIQEHIFNPLEMYDSSILPFTSNNQAKGHFTGIVESIVSNSLDPVSGEFIPAGSYAQSTSSDLAHYLTMYLNSGRWNENSILDSELIKKMMQPEIEFVGLSAKDGGDGSNYYYGLGWMLSHIDGREVVHHGGSTGQASSFTIMDLHSGIGVCLLTNIDLTLIDRYQYKFGLHIVNNILHLTNGHPVTEYGIPVIKDPTINEYELPTHLYQQYSGRYLFKQGGDNFVYYDQPSLLINHEGDELIGIIERKDQVINKFVLDFVNPSFAVSRNIASPTYVRFKLDKKGKVYSVYCFGMELHKIPQSDAQETATTEYGPVQFKHSVDWYPSKTDDRLIFTHGLHNSIQIECEWLSKIADYKEGIKTIERIQARSWEKISTYVKDDNRKNMMTAFTTKVGEQYLMLKFISSPEDHSYYLNEEMIKFINSMGLKL